MEPGETPIRRARAMLRDNGLNWTDLPIRHELRKAALHLSETQMDIEKGEEIRARKGELKPRTADRHQEAKRRLPQLQQEFNVCLDRAKMMQAPEPATGKARCPNCGHTFRVGKNWPWHTPAGQNLRGIPHKQTDMSGFCGTSGTPAPN